jgi:hypothetical protein
MRRTVLTAAMVVFAVSVWAQSRTSSVPISLRVPGSISISLHSVPVLVAVRNGNSQSFQVPVTVEWNLNPQETPGFSIAAYFRDPNAALEEVTSGTSLRADDLTVSWGADQGQLFQSGEATLFQRAVDSGQRRGKESEALSLSIANDVVATVEDGDYQGVLYLEVRSY